MIRAGTDGGRARFSHSARHPTGRHQCHERWRQASCSRSRCSAPRRRLRRRGWSPRRSSRRRSPTSWSATPSRSARRRATPSPRSSSISTACARRMLRGNGAPIHTLDNAFYKAYSAASLTLARKEDSTKAVAERMAKNPATSVPSTPLPNVTYAVGGVTIMAGGKAIGAHRRERRPRRPVRRRLRPRGHRQDPGPDEVVRRGSRARPHRRRPRRADRLRRLPPGPDPGRSRAAGGDAARPRRLGHADRRLPRAPAADHLHDPGQPGRRRRRRAAPDRPQRPDRRPLAHQLRRGHAGGRLPRRDRAPARGLRLPEAPPQRLLRHRRRRAARACSAAPRS